MLQHACTYPISCFLLSKRLEEQAELDLLLLLLAIFPQCFKLAPLDHFIPCQHVGVQLLCP